LASRKVIITCAVTGSIHTPTMSPHLPITPHEIAASAVGAAEAGAAILHLHARDPSNGRPTADPEVFRQFLQKIKADTDAVINITTGGGQNMSIDDRLKGPLALQPEMSSLNMGSMNFGLYPILDKVRDWKHEWEPPFFMQTIFGILGGIGAEIENLVHMRRIADKLFGSEYQWSILAAGRHQTNFVTTGAIMGGNIRVGLEDNLYIAKGVMAESNAQQVSKIRGIVDALSLEIATPAEVRELLSLKGADQVKF